MPFFTELLDPYARAIERREERGLYARGPHIRRPSPSRDPDVLRRTIAKIQPELEGPSVGGFLKNFGSDVSRFALGTGALVGQTLLDVATTGGQRTAATVGRGIEAAVSDPDETFAALLAPYREAYTPRDEESIPQMLGRQFYEHPFETLMDASFVLQGTGLGMARLASAAGATRTARIAEEVATRAARIDPITAAVGTGKFLYRTIRPDAAAALRVRSTATDALAERTATLRYLDDQAKVKIDEVLSDLTPEERLLFHPYVDGRMIVDEGSRGSRVFEHTGEWVPLKGDSFRPEVLEAARQRYIPLQEEMDRLAGRHPEQVADLARRDAEYRMKEWLGEAWDPLHPQVQAQLDDAAQAAYLKAEESRLRRQTITQRTALDVAKEKKWTKDAEEMRDRLHLKDLDEVERLMPKPVATTIEEALRITGPQGGLIFPHTGEVLTREQSTVENLVTKLGEASIYKENTGAMFRSGLLQHQDPAKMLLNAYRQVYNGDSFVMVVRDALEEQLSAGGRAAKVSEKLQRLLPKGLADRFSGQSIVERMTPAEAKARKYNPALDPDLRAGTHQLVHPGLALLDDFVQDDMQRTITRLIETSDDVGGVNLGDLVEAAVRHAERSYPLRKDIPFYKVPTDIGHAIKELRTQMDPPTHPLAQHLDNLTQHWNWYNLNARFARILNNVVGNTTFAAMQGVHPFSFRGMQALLAAGRAAGARAGFLTDAESRRLAGAFELPGVGGGLQSMLIREFGSVGERHLASGSRLRRVLGTYGHMIEHANRHAEEFSRVAGLFFEMSPGWKRRMQEMFGQAGTSMALGERVQQLHQRARAGGAAAVKEVMQDPTYKEGLGQVNRFYNNYDRATPFERRWVRRWFPYFKFYKHSVELAMRFPFEHPLRGQVARQLATSALQDTKEQLDEWGYDWRDIPEGLRDAVPVHVTQDELGQPIVTLLSTKGANPFSALTGRPAEEALSLLNPLVKMAFERATGINLFTREKYRGAISSFVGREVNPETEAIEESFQTPSAPELFLRQFWPYQLVRDMVAQGRVPTDTASLLDMATNAPTAWEFDDRGFVRERPQIVRFQPLARIFGPVPRALEKPSAKVLASRKAIITSQLADIRQRYPERERDIRRALLESRREVAAERREKRLRGR